MQSTDATFSSSWSCRFQLSEGVLSDNELFSTTQLATQFHLLYLTKFVAILLGETCRPTFQCPFPSLFLVILTLCAISNSVFFRVQAEYLMYLMLDSHFWVVYLPVAKGANPTVYLGQYLKQRSKLYKPIVIMFLQREF